MEAILAIAIGVVASTGVWLLLRGRTFQVVIGLALLTQPAVSALAGWLAFGEVLSAGDVAGMVLLAGALAMAKVGDRS